MAEKESSQKEKDSERERELAARKREWQIQKAQTQYQDQRTSEGIWLLMMLFAQREKAMVENKPDEKEDAEKQLSELYGIDNPDKVLPKVLKDIDEGRDVYKTLAKNNPRFDPLSQDLEIRRSALFNSKMGDRQKIVLDTLKDAANSAHVSLQTMCGMWGVESSFGRNLTSASNCQGDWQFTRGTWASTIRIHGNEIANRLAATGHHAEAESLRHHVAMLKSDGGYKNNASLQVLRNDARISTYAAAFYLQDVAKEIGVNPSKSENAGVLYAGYNVGPAAARRLKGDLNDDFGAGKELGSVARWNPLFFRDKEGNFTLTGKQALEKYQSKVGENFAVFSSKFSMAVDTGSSGGGPKHKDDAGGKLEKASNVFASTFGNAASVSTQTAATTNGPKPTTI